VGHGHQRGYLSFVFYFARLFSYEKTPDHHGFNPLEIKNRASITGCFFIRQASVSLNLLKSNVINLSFRSETNHAFVQILTFLFSKLLCIMLKKISPVGAET